MRSREDVDRAALIVAKWTPRDIGWDDVQAEAPRCWAPRGRGPTPRRDGLARVDGCWFPTLIELETRVALRHEPVLS